MEEKLKDKDNIIRNLEVEISKYKKMISELMEQLEKTKDVEAVIKENEELKKKITNLLSLIEKMEKQKQIEIEKLQEKIKRLEREKTFEKENTLKEENKEKTSKEIIFNDKIVDNGISGVVTEKIKNVFNNYNPIFDYFNAIKKLLNITKNIKITDKKHNTLEEVIDNFEGTKDEICVLFKNVAEKLGKNKIAIIKYLDTNEKENYMCGIKIGDSYIICDPFSGEINLKKYKDLKSLSFVKEVLEVIE
jgi:DNA repair exonuclease SbcCD ATPase subunit